MNGPPAAMAPPGGRGRHALLLAAAVALFFAPAFQPGLQFLHRDQGRLHHPLKKYVAEELARGHYPQWIPEIGLGMPVVAGTADGMQHPFHLLLLALPFELGLKLWLVLMVWLAGLGAASLARRLGADPPAALVAGAAFAFSGFVVSSTDNMTYLSALALAPWLLSAGVAHAARGGAGRLAGVGAVSFLCLAAGDPQGWGIAVALLPLAPLLAAGPELGPGAGPRWPVRLRRAAAAVAVAVVAAAPILLPLALWTPASSRADPFDAIVHLQYSMLPVRLVELVVPGLLREAAAVPISPLYMAYAGDGTTPIPWLGSGYVGVTVAALALLSARTWRGRWLLLATALAAWAALGRHGGFGQLARSLPLLSSLRYWEKLAAWVHLGLALAAAGGAQALLRGAGGGGPTRRLPAALAAAAAALLAVAAAARLAPGAVARLVAPPGGDLAAADRFTANLGAGALHAAVALALLAVAAALLRRPAAGRLAPLAPLLLAGVVALDAAAGNLPAYLLSPLAIAPGGGPAGPAGPIVEALRAQPERPRVVTPLEIPPLAVPGLSPAEAMARFGARTATSGWNVALRLGNFDFYTGMPPARASRYRRRTGAFHLLPGVGLFGVTHAAIPGPPERAAEANFPGPHRVAAEDRALGAVLLEVPHRPRAYLARQVREVDRRGAMEFALDGRNATSDQTVVEAPVPAGHGGTAGRAEVVDDRAERLEVAVEAEAAGLLVLNDAFTTGWEAEVDGRPAGIVPANYLVRGVWVPAGRHRVEFRYRTPGLLEGWLLLAAGGLALALLALRERRGSPAGAAPPG